MRTRALLYIAAGFVILAILVAMDLVAFGYPRVHGIAWESLRALVQAGALLAFYRGTRRLFKRALDVSRRDDPAQATWYPVKLVKRFTAVFAVVVALVLVPQLMQLAFNVRPRTPGTVITIGLIGAVWLFVQIFASVSFSQLLFVRQHTLRNRKRINRWLVGIAAFSIFFFLDGQEVIARETIAMIFISVLTFALMFAALQLGYRLPWLPYLARKEKRTLMILSAVNVILAIAALIFYTEPTKSRMVYEFYSDFWHTASVAYIGTIGVYFTLVFFSSLFSFSSTELVERKSAEVKSLARLTRFSSDVLTSELLLDLPKLAEQITTLACEATDADAAWLELKTTIGPSEEPELIRSYVGIDTQTAESIMARAEGFPEASRTISSPRGELSSSRKGFILRKRMTVAQQLQPVNGNGTSDLHSLLAVPLIRKGEARGGLYVAKKAEDGFDDDDLTVLEAFSDVASLALETARLLADSIERQKFDGELRAARAMHKSLLPEHFPEIPNFEVHAVSIPAYDVGGDYYDFSTLWDGSPVVVIGDVSGKGISASLYMAETKGVIQALTPIMSSTQELLESANGALLRNTPQQAVFRRNFVTLGMLAFHRNGIRYIRAGHTPLLIVREDGSYEYVQPKGMAVGLMRQVMFNQGIEPRDILIRKGDSIVMFSDGITDTRDETGEDYGYERFARSVVEHRCAQSAKQMTDRIIEDVIRFAATSTFGDDATVIVARCIETPGQSSLVLPS
ncbi:MAG TPA: GAF domain-containing SpoIIE family protein phosphatase [Candidatus Kapabacteria bacterium]|jgi:serine phosphatase RsbU (regulator of sigma subunit)|nr:GAF domain-containing SpoIIE family protein phosphatase [Candidatus Kapabacteria bacterium]